ncbi:MAG: anaerobic ribonucleoside-triphosphate reductase activating protein [Clostridia bacterium]|nr:anaerobic ribonucleoside-triphosphate reductase activating protein [Clostridia bacterium]
MSKIRIAGIESESITDGPGLRFVVFTQGCPHKCEGCHNPKTHDVNGGYEIDTIELVNMIYDNPLLSGVTISGGEPLLQADKLIDFAINVKQKKLDIALYTGYTFEEIIKRNNKHVIELLSMVDVLIDGKFELEKRSLDLKFKGSSNQRIINLKESFLQNKVVLMENSSWN